MKVYLCGGINGLTDGQAKDWREEARALINGECLDPMRRDYRGKEDESVEEIYRGDLADIVACDVVLVNASRASWGTAMEMVYARLMGKRVIAVVPSGPISPWLRKHSDLIVTTLTEAVERLTV